MKPNFDLVWHEATTIPEFQAYTQKDWKELAKQGQINKFSKIKKFVNVEKIKSIPKNKTKSSLQNMPIIVKFSNENYQILGDMSAIQESLGKNNNIDVWIVDISNCAFLIQPSHCAN